jgi:hypothetical protein
VGAEAGGQVAEGGAVVVDQSLTRESMARAK